MAGRQRKAERRDGSFDAYDLVRRRASFAGRFDSASLPRAADQLASQGGSLDVSWRISGIVDPSGRPALEVRVEGSVPLVCQRCLQPFGWHVAQQTTVLLARDERELETLDADGEHEVILASAPLDAAMLAEDELLLTLPFVPRCERAECVQASMAGTRDPDARASARAFAALAAIKPSGGNKGRN